jgi:hypothetical protein
VPARPAGQTGAPRLSGAERSDIDRRREPTEEEAAFMVLPLGIVPRQQDRASAEAKTATSARPAEPVTPSSSADPGSTDPDSDSDAGERSTPDSHQRGA